MALPFEIQIGRISRFLSKWASTKGSSPRVTLGSEIIPMLPMWSGVENRYLDSWNRYFLQISLAAGGAGNFGKIRFRNLAGSRTVDVFEKITFGGSGNDSPLTSQAPGIVANLGTVLVPSNNRMDARSQSGAPQVVISQENNTITQVLAGGISWQSFFLGNTQADMILTDNQELTLLPGDTIQFSSNVTNGGFTVSFMFRERSLEESELS